jgi:tRNA A-37 threonylcarbamoyl transferase component Bud32
MLGIFKKELQERYPEHQLQVLESTKHRNVLRLLKEGSPSLIAKTIWHDVSDPNGTMGVKAQDKAYTTEVKILKMLPDWWIFHHVDHFKTKDNRIIITNEVTSIPWTSYKAHESDITIAKKLAKQIHWLHSHKIAHNDLELKNILLTKSGDPVIIDFEKSSLGATKKQMEDDYRMLLDNLNEFPNTKSIGNYLKNANRGKSRKNRRTLKRDKN